MVQQDGEAERWAAVDAHVAVGQDLGEVLGEDILIGPLDPAVDDVGDAEAVEVGQLLGGLARVEVTADRQLRV